MRAVEAWEERARVMAPLLDAFLGGEEALAYPDLDTMARLDLVFRTETRVSLYSLAPAHLHTCSSAHRHTCSSAHLQTCSPTHLLICTPAQLLPYIPPPLHPCTPAPLLPRCTCTP